MKLLTLGCTLLLMACASVAGAQTVEPSPARLHTVVVVTGDVTFKRPEWTTFAPAKFGTTLRTGDIVRFAAGASMLVVCDGFAAAITVEGPGAKPVPCEGRASTTPTWWDLPVPPTARLDLSPTLNAQYSPSTVNAMKAILDKGATASKRRLAIEQVLTTTGPATFDTTPTITWPEVPGADQYQVSLIGPGVDTKRFVYTNDTSSWQEIPDLEVGNYLVTVVPYSKAKPLSIATLAWSLKRTIAVPERPALDPQQAGAELDKLKLSPIIRGFLLGQVLARGGKFEDALTTLNLTLTQLQEPALMREIGLIHVAQQNYDKAGKSYSDAVQLSAKNGDVVGEALADEAMANIDAKVPQQLPMAITRLRRALDIYRSLGDKFNIERLQVVMQGYEMVGKAVPATPAPR